MKVTMSENAGNSGAEEQFVQLFCDVFGVEKGQFVYLQHPFVDIYGNHRTIDFAVMTDDEKIAFEIDGETWHKNNASFDISGYHHNMFGGFLSLRPGIYSSGEGSVTFRNFQYIPIE